MSKAEAMQRETCARLDVAFHGAPSDQIAGVARAVGSGLQPLHGLRHPVTDATTGWYIWAGEYQSDADFFEPLHVRHLEEACPAVLPYLGLPPGWRFLSADGHEDVWFDASVLDA